MHIWIFFPSVIHIHIHRAGERAIQSAIIPKIAKSSNELLSHLQQEWM